MQGFQDKVAIVTGGASGIGRAVCEKMGQRGARLIVADINEEGTREVAEAISAAGGKAQATLLDVTRRDEVKNLVTETANRYGRLDYMFNNAGVGVLGDERDKTDEHWQKIFDVNLNGVIHGTRAAYDLMTEQGSGHIVNTASLAGLIPSPMEVAYGTTKHAVVGLSVSLRAEGAALGVKVSVVCPGFIRTPIMDTTPVLNVNKEELMARSPDFMMMDVDKAALAVLKGVSRNQALIVFPFHARLSWRLNRLHPSILNGIGRLQIKNFRKFRKES